MSTRIRILAAIMVVGFVIRATISNPSWSRTNLTYSTIFIVAMVVMIYLHARKNREIVGVGALFVHSLVASIACSVALVIVLHVTLILFGLDFFELVSVQFIPGVILLTAALCFPLCWRLLK